MGKSKHESLSALDKSTFRACKGKFKESCGKKKSESSGDPSENEKGLEKEEKEKKKFWKKCLSFVRKHSSLIHQRNKNLKFTKSSITDGDKNPTAAAEDSKVVCDRHEYNDTIENPNIKSEVQIATYTYDNAELKEERSTEAVPTEVPANTVLTSELYIRQDMSSIVESGVFFDPTLTRDYSNLPQSKETSQKSMKVSKLQLSCKVVDEGSEDTIKTFKTVSEPSWNERKRILQHQRLQENINNLLEQFLFLEDDDTLAGSSPSQNKLSEGKKMMELEKLSRVSRELSREVSPEILVNIKPFKEPVSEDFNHIQVFSAKMVFNKDTEQDYSKALVKYEAPKTSIRPGTEPDVVSTEEERETMSLSMSMTEKETKPTCSNKCTDLVPFSNNDEPLEPPTCTVWGVYKSYSTCNAEEEEAEEPKQNTLDELLNTLDGTNHESVFQKNLSQFKRKINVLPHLDLKKSGKRKQEQKRMQKSENALRTDKSFPKKITGFSESSSETGKRKNVGKFRMEPIKIGNTGRKTKKILENVFLLRSEPILFSRTLGTRMETSSLNLVENLKELYSMPELNRAMLMKLETPLAYNDNVTNLSSVSETKNLGVNEIMRRIPHSGLTGSCSFHGSPFSFQIKSEAELGKLTSESGTFLENLKVKGPRVTEKRNFLKLITMVYNATHQVIQILNDSNCYVVLIYEKVVPCSIPSAQSHSEPDVPKKSLVGSIPASVNSAVLDVDSALSINEKTLKNIYNFDQIQVRSRLLIETDKDKELKEAENQAKNVEKQPEYEVELQGTLERKLSKILKHKSNSSPRETIVRSEFGALDSRPRRSLNLSKEPDSRKKILLIDKSISLVSQTETLENKNRIKDPHHGFRPPEELKLLTGMADQNRRQKTLVLDKMGSNVREEMMAAFNTIKEMSNWKKDPKGGNKRMSMVILVSKK